MNDFQIFVSWSGKKSWHIAHRIAEWMPTIVPNTRYYLSSEIPAGSLWLTHLMNGLAASQMALLCITKDNIQSQWLNFEAGAMWNRYGADMLICPILFELDPNELAGPLSQFQSKTFTERDMKYLAKTIGSKSNFVGDRPDRIDINFKTTWPQLARDVKEDIDSLINRVGSLSETNKVSNDIDEFESASLQIMSYLNHNNFNSMKFATIRKKIDSSWDDEFLLKLIKKYARKFRRANFNDGSIGIGKAPL